MKFAGEPHYLWRAIDHENKVVEAFATKTRDMTAAPKFLKKAMKRYGRPDRIITDGLASYDTATKQTGSNGKRMVARHLNNQAEHSHLPFR